MADVAFDGLRPELGEALTEYYRVDDLHDFGALIRASVSSSVAAARSTGSTR